jgi:hypothetical protein
MKKIILSTIVASTLLCTSALSKDYATVNGEKVTSNDIQLIIKDPKVDYNTLPKDIQTKILNQVINAKLLGQYTSKSKVTKQKEYKEAFNKLKVKLALEFWMQNLLKEIKTTDKNLKKFYKENKDKFTQKAVLNARHILVADEKTAKDIIKTLNKSKNLKEEFIKLAKSKSTGPSGVNGGELGWFEPKQMVPEFSDAAKALKKGTITAKPVKTQFGYHIIYLEDKKSEGVANFKDAKLKIEEIVKQTMFVEKIQAKIAKLRKKAKIVMSK